MNIKERLHKELEYIMEIRNPLINYLKKELPNTPEYIIKDMLYPAVKDTDNHNLLTWVNDMKGFTWELHKNFLIKKEFFGQQTIDQINKRLKGENPNQVPKDDERHETQKNLIIKRGLPKEPIIIVYDKGQYELWEGWHRTIQLLKIFPDGFKYPNVYIGTKKI